MKYKNISEFNQSIFISGKRIIIEPNQIIESPRELKYVFLEKIDDKEQESENKINQIVSEPKALEVSHKYEKIEKAEKVINDEIENLKKKIENIEATLNKINEKINFLEDNIQNNIHRKMEMLKLATMALQEEVYNIKFDENGKIIS